MNMKEKLLILLAVGAGTFALFFVISAVWIGQEVKNRCFEAQGRYGGECVPALMHWLDDPDNDYGSRNSATWALGQMGDRRAFPVLEKYYTGDIPDREKWDGVLSQYELKKAIKLLESGVNITAPFWRW